MATYSHISRCQFLMKSGAGGPYNASPFNSSGFSGLVGSLDCFFSLRSRSAANGFFFHEDSQCNMTYDSTISGTSNRKLLLPAQLLSTRSIHLSLTLGNEWMCQLATRAHSARSVSIWGSDGAKRAFPGVPALKGNHHNVLDCIRSINAGSTRWFIQKLNRGRMILEDFMMEYVCVEMVA